jgi:hypothetical protein
MRKMGIWFENFGLPAVINESLMQSYTGVIRLFPNWPVEKNAAFETMRAAGGFLVSSSIKNGIVEEIRIFCENDNELKLYNPWSENVNVQVVIDKAETGLTKGQIIQLKVKKGQLVSFKPYIQ